jgi:hypothetical protein
VTFQDIQSYILARLRQRGVNFGGVPGNGATDLDPPVLVKLAANTAYNVTLRRTLDFRPATIDVDFLTVAGATNFSLQPLPNGYNGATGFVPNSALRPAIMQVYELRYFYGNPGAVGGLAQERYIPSISTVKFRRLTGGYTQRQGTLGPFPRRVVQIYGLKRVDLFPGFATTNDTVKLYACPDPQGTEQAYPGGQIPCAYGGQLTNPLDVPLLPNDLHMALVHHATAQLCGISDKASEEKKEYALWQSYIDVLDEYGATTMEGEAEQQVEDIWSTSFDVDAVY